MRFEPTPRFPVRNYKTRGSFPQVSGPGSLTGVNAALRDLILSDQATYAVSAKRNALLLPDKYPGLYQTFRPTLASASTVVVSVLLPVRELYPGGNDGDFWLSRTIDTATGKIVTVTALFSEPKAALTAISHDVERQLRDTPGCVGSSYRQQPIVVPYYLSYLTPKANNFRRFALTPSGLALGFGMGAVAGVPCGRISVVVPYATLHPYLSSYGMKLIAGVRQPT